MDEPVRPNSPPNPEDVPFVFPVEDPILRPDKPGSASQSAFWIGLFGFCLVYGYLLTVGGEVGRIAAAGLESIPFLLLAVLAYGGNRQGWLRVITGIYWVLLVGAVAAGAWLLTVVGMFDWSKAALLSDPTMKPGRDYNLPDLFRPGSVQVLGLSLLCLVAAFSLGAICFLAAVRRFFANLVPMNAESFVHATALATVVGLTLISFVPLGILGEPPLLRLLKQVAEQKAAPDWSESIQLRDQIYSLLWLVPAAIIAAGYPQSRTFRQTMVRVGLVSPRRWQILLAVGAAAGLVWGMLGFEFGITSLWKKMDWPETDAKAFNDMMRFAINPIGAVIVGVVAGLGEELGIRGVLQPRMGIVLSNLFFTSLHAFQYNFDGLASVFLIGLVLGVIRKYTNTTTSAMVHGLYDGLLIEFAYLQLPGFTQEAWILTTW
ncbi:MAG TPA: type II CAAX endopeptidase family protein [Gemmataceae bacterium]|jgi:membrane protease YdiL (CAAX protease family)|nr:type II CAAX endopeptidase family protein [Gemmataceae bacterium]